MSAAGEPESSKDSDIGPICDLALAELIIDVLGLEEEPYAVRVCEARRIAPPWRIRSAARKRGRRLLGVTSRVFG
eukprot:365048-Chlamydomonas_euryale.AAC.5